MIHLDKKVIKFKYGEKKTHPRPEVMVACCCMMSIPVPFWAFAAAVGPRRIADAGAGPCGTAQCPHAICQFSKVPGAHARFATSPFGIGCIFLG